jgi:acyl carrier protein
VNPMTKAKFIEKLGAELGIPPATLLEEALLNSFKAWDSMGHMAVLAMIDAELGCEVPPGALQKCKTVGDLVTLVGSKLES